MDQDQQWIFNCLTAILDINQDIRSFAEASVKEASSQFGFGVALSKVTANKELPLGQRQLAAVLLKQFIKEHWQEDDPHYVPPVVSSMEKASIRNILLQALADTSRKICKAVSMAIASIARYDWPEEWADLMPFLLNMINDKINLHGVHGGLRCLALLSDDLDDTSVPALVPVLFPNLYTIVSSYHAYDKHTRTMALSIVHSCVSTLGSISGVYKSEIRQLMVPMFKAWMEQFSHVLEVPVQSDDSDDWNIRMEVLKCLIQFVQNFRGLGERESVATLTSSWQTFVSCLRVYELSSIHGITDPYCGNVDSDCQDTSLEAFVIQLFEFFLTIIGDQKLSKAVKGNIKELAYYTVAFLQMTEEQVQIWAIDVNQYVVDEDDNAYSCRISGLLLLEEVVKAYDEGIDAVMEAAQERLKESSEAKASGSSSWWKLREAAIFSLGALSEVVVEPEVDELMKIKIGKFIETMLMEDIVIDFHENPFLSARAFSVVAKFSSVIGQERLSSFLLEAVKAITLEVPAPVKVGACSALPQLLKYSNNDTIQPYVLGLLSAIVELLKQASYETLHLVLETLQSAVMAGHEAVVSVESVISPLVLNLWAQHVSDPFISVDAIEVLEAIKDAPGCFQPLVSRILPSIVPILQNPCHQEEGLVAGSLDLLTMLIKKAPLHVLKQAYDLCFNLVVRIVVAKSEDHAEIQVVLAQKNATECLSAFVFGGREEFLSWGSDPSFTMRTLFDCATRLLDPCLDSSASLFVGGYILQLILHLPTHMQQHLQSLVNSLVKRMESSQISGLKSSIILVYARLVHLCVPHIGQFVDLLHSIPVQGYNSSLFYVMSEWTKQQVEIQGRYEIKVTTSALALLLSSQHVELAKVYVQGNLIKSNSGIVTRSKAKSAPDRWTMVPLPLKILSILADMLLELQEQILNKDNEDSEYEEVQNPDDLLHQTLIYSTSPSGISSVEQLDAIEKVFLESEEDNDEDLLTQDDPLNKINLASYIMECISQFSNNHRQTFDLLFQSLTPAQRNIIQTAIRH